MLLTSGNYCETLWSLAVVGGLESIWLNWDSPFEDWAKQAGCLHDDVIKHRDTVCVWGAAAKRSISADLNWKSLSVQPLTSELPLLSTLWGERDTVWWSLIWRAYCSYSHKSLILPETLSFKCIFHLALHENNCACCHKIKNTYGLQQKVCHSALPTKYQQLNVFLYQICFVWKTNWGNLHLFFSLCDSNKNK